MSVIKGFVKGVWFVIKVILIIIGIGTFGIALGEAFDVALDDDGNFMDKPFGQRYDELYDRWSRGYEKLKKS